VAGLIAPQEKTFMLPRNLLKALFLASFVIPFIGCSSSQVDSIAVTPGTQSVATGKTVQYTATAVVGHAGHPSQNVTNSVTWSSSDTSIATVSSTGVATGVGAGSATITASSNGFGGLISGTATLTVTGGGGGGTGADLTSLVIIPGSQAVSSPSETTQFIAIGTTSTGATENVTNQVNWRSSSVQVAQVGSTTGLATGVGQGTATITAIATNPDSSVVTGSATFTVTGGTAEPYTALTITPGAQSLSATGQTGQFAALATAGSTNLTEDVTNSAKITWTSSVPTIASVSSYPTNPAGLVAGVTPGQTTITAKLTNPDGSVVTATATVTVSASAAPEPLLSITVVPNGANSTVLDATVQFLAYGTFSTAPTVQDITNGIDRNGFKSPVNWVSTFPYVFTINSSGAPGGEAGLATNYGSGISDIYAVATNPDGTLVYSTPVQFSCPYAPYVNAANPGTCNDHMIAGGLLVTLTVFNAGLNQTNWLITAPSATGTPDVIHCGPGSTTGGSVCEATYPVGTTVTLTAPVQPGVAFGGWSFNCTAITPVTAAGPNSCTVVLGDASAPNVSVGGIFN
jgi:uncharacterized protein YjdB